MKSHNLLRTACLTAFSILFTLTAHAEVRTWTSAEGDRTFEAELLSFNPETGEVGVRRNDGLELKFQSNVLSAADLEYLKSIGPKAAPAEASSPGTTVAPSGDGGNGDEPADMSKPVQVFILLGQSNMLGFGKTLGANDPKSVEHAVKQENLYPFLLNDAGEWLKRQDVRNVRVMSKGSGMQVFTNDWLTISNSNIGPEIGIGHHLGNLYQAPVLVLKSCIGNRSLGWDLLPPGTEPYEHNGKTQPGYRGTQDNPKGTGEKPAAGWYAGKQYDDDIAHAKAVLNDLDTYYPGATAYEVAGFFWWQGDKDMRNDAHATYYEKNLVRLIKALRADFEAPEAKFVIATLGQTKEGTGGGQGKLLQAKMNLDTKSGKYPEFKGAVATVYSHPLSKGGSSSGHYSSHGQTYMNIGLAMGEAMVELLTGNR